MDSSNVAVRLQGPRVTVRTLRREDLSKMDGWRPSRDPLSALWGAPPSLSVSHSLWLTAYGSDPSRQWYVVERNADGQVIGTLSLREIMHPVSARLGIGFGAEYVDQGYGTESLRLFLPYYFGVLGFRELLLDVAAANRRAVHVYEKLGWRYASSHYRDVPEGVDLGFLQNEAYRALRPYFRRYFGRMQLLHYDMVLERGNWLKQQLTLDG